MACCTGDMGGMMAGMWIVGLLWVGVAVAAIVVVSRAFGRHRSDHVPMDTAMSALRERYARGDIDESDYQTRATVLRGIARHDQDTQN